MLTGLLSPLVKPLWWLANRPGVITGNSWVILGSIYMMCDHLCPEVMTKKWNLLVKITNTERSCLAVLFAQLHVN